VNRDVSGRFLGPHPPRQQHAEHVAIENGAIAVDSLLCDRAGLTFRAGTIAQAIVFLASDKATFITGQVFGVDGGKMA